MATCHAHLRRFWSVALLSFLGFLGCSSQRWEHFTVPTPIAAEDTLIIGFHGGRDAWKNEKVGVGRMAERARGLQLPRTHVRSVEDTNRRPAPRLRKAAGDRHKQS